ncbi:C25L1 protein, partial [Amia calva]|nr:C25L1 protein [Amia calva]
MWNKSMVLNFLRTKSSSDVLLQPTWDHIRLHHHSTVSSPFFPVLIAFCSYLSFSLPFAIIDLLGEKLPFFYRYKIQKERQPTVGLMATCLCQVVYKYVVFVIPAVVVNSFVMPSSPLHTRAPSVLELATGVLGCLLLFDFQYYLWHLVHHKNRYLYRSVHSYHHSYTAPFSWTTQHLSVVEMMTVGFWIQTNPLLLACHPLTGWTCIIIGTWMSVEGHVGYEMPWALNNIIPLGLYGGTPAHDMHHQKPHSNFAPFFSHWDKICGTAISVDRDTRLVQKGNF